MLPNQKGKTEMRINRSMLALGLVIALGVVPMARGGAISDGPLDGWRASSAVTYKGAVWHYGWDGNNTPIVYPEQGSVSVSIGKSSSAGTSRVTLKYSVAGGGSGSVSFDWNCTSYNCDYSADGHSFLLGFDYYQSGEGDVFSGLWIEIDQTAFIAKPGTSGGGSRPKPPSDIPIPQAWRKAHTLYGAVWSRWGDFVGTIAVKCGKANRYGKAKVSADLTYLEGGKVKLAAQTVDVSSGDAELSWPDAEISSLQVDGDTFSCSGRDVSGGQEEIGGAVTRDAYFPFWYVPDEINGTAVLYPFEDEPFRMDGNRWVFAKKASMKWEKAKCVDGWCTTNGPGSWRVDTSRGRTNISGLKLSYSPRNGTFRGSFTVYLWADGGKKLGVTVKGVVVQGRAYAVALFKQPGMCSFFDF